MDDENEKVAKIVATEDIVFIHHPDATIFRYPLNYGPGQIVPREWTIVRRLIDGRRRFVVADGGLDLRTASYGPNAARALVLAAGQDIAAGKACNIGDEHVVTGYQTIQVLGAALDCDIEIVSMPAQLATPARPFMGHEHALHKLTVSDALIHELGYAT